MKEKRINMRLFNIVALSALTVIGMVSCEIGEERTSVGQDMGALELAVSVKTPVSQMRAAVSADDFPVTIAGKTGTEVESVVKNFSTVAEVPVSLPLAVGTYVVSSHSPGTLEKKMTAPYYAGSSQLIITKGITTQTVVTCKMKNSRIQMNYDPSFLAAFSSWVITVDDGSDTALSFDETDTAPASIYWLFGDNVSSLKVNFSAITVFGARVRDSRTFTKSQAAEQYDDESEFFTGGDGLIINMKHDAGAAGSVSGIDIALNIKFENHTDEVEIPVDPNPTPGEGDGPSLALPADAIYKEDGTGMPSSADALIKADAGFESIVVKITAGNRGFDDILTDLKMDGQSFIEGVDLIDNTDFGMLLSGVDENLSAPHEGDTSYTFPLGVFFTFLNLTGATDAGQAHQFDIVVTDKNGKTVSGTYKVTITG